MVAFVHCKIKVNDKIINVLQILSSPKSPKIIFEHSLCLVLYSSAEDYYIGRILFICFAFKSVKEEPFP